MIYFVEGIPAVGKSYYSRKLEEEVIKNRDVIYYKEEYKNPLDLLRQAFLTNSEYDVLLSELRSMCTKEFYPSLKSEIQNSIMTIDDRVIIPFMHIRTQTEEQRKYLDSLYDKELDDGKCSYVNYYNIIIKRLQKFLQEIDSGKDYIFEGALLHNPLFSILGFYDVDENEIIKFYNKIERLLSNTAYEIHLVYCDNIERAITHAITARKPQDGYKWENGFERWLRQSRNYRNLKGQEGIIAFAKDIAHYENIILEKVSFLHKRIKREV